MKKMKLLVEFEYDDDLMHGDDKNVEDWFLSILINDTLFLEDRGDLGDEMGTIKVLSIVEQRLHRVKYE